MYEKGTYFKISGAYKNILSVNMFYYAKGMKLNDEIIEIKNLSK